MEFGSPIGIPVYDFYVIGSQMALFYPTAISWESTTAVQIIK